MIRNIGGVVLGYITFALALFLAFSAAYLLMGANLAFRPHTYEPSNLWLVTSVILGTASSVVGGYVCALLARGSKAPIALAILVIVIGLLSAIPVLRAANTSKEQVPRPAEVSNLQAMQNAVQPGWMALLNPFVGAAGVLVGARLRRSPEN